MNRQNRFLQYKRIKNGLPAYDLAEKQTSAGYQQGDDFSVGTPSIKTGNEPSQEEVDAGKPTLGSIAQQASPYIMAYKQPLVDIGKQIGGLFAKKGVETGTKTALTNAVTNSMSQFGTNLFRNVGNTMFNAGISTGSSVLTNAGTTMLQSTMPSFSSQVGNFGANMFTNKLAPSFLQNGGKAVLQEGGKAATKSALGTIGNAASVAGAVYGLYNLGNGLAKGPDVPTSAQMDQGRTETTQSINGVDYTTKSMGNSALYDKMLKNAETGRTVSNTISGIGAGVGTALAAGALAGSSLGPLGIIGGGVLGGLIGGIGSLFGKGKRKRKLQERKQALVQSYDNYNAQSESAAASEGLRNEFYKNTTNGSSLYSADIGKSAFTDGKSSALYGDLSTSLRDRLMKRFTDEYGMVFDKDGYHFGKKESKVGYGESIANFNTGQMTYINKGKKRADDQFSSVKEGDDNYIAGNDIDWTNGISFADQVAPFSKRFGELNKIEASIQNNKYGSNATKQLNLQQSQQMKQQLLEEAKGPLKRQEMQHKIQRKYDGGMPMYDDGKPANNKANLGSALNWLQPLIYAGGYSIPSSQYRYYKNGAPTAQNSYVRNSNADRALGILGSMRFDPYQQAQQINNAYRQGLYNINQSAGLSGGQRMAMLAAHNNSYMGNMANLYGEANNTNNKYRQAYAQAMLEAGERDAARQQQALAQQQQDYRDAVARRLAGMESANQGKLNMLNSLGKSIFQQMEYAGTKDYNNKQLDLYNRQLDIEAKKAGIPNTTYEQSDEEPVYTYPKIKQPKIKQKVWRKIINYKPEDIYDYNDVPEQTYNTYMG